VTFVPWALPTAIRFNRFAVTGFLAVSCSILFCALYRLSADTLEKSERELDVAALSRLAWRLKTKTLRGRSFNGLTIQFGEHQESRGGMIWQTTERESRE
jgi:hypothetical protein